MGGNYFSSFFFALLLIVLAGILMFISINLYVYRMGSNLLKHPQVGTYDAILILGARVYNDGRVSPMLKDRLDEGFRLFNMGYSDVIILSGCGEEKSNREPTAMADYLVEKGLARENIVLDDYGFDTYKSMQNLIKDFKVERVLVVSQEYHLVRALYMAQRLGITAQGSKADTYRYKDMPYYEKRELLSRVKAFYKCEIEFKILGFGGSK